MLARDACTRRDVDEPFDWARRMLLRFMLAIAIVLANQEMDDARPGEGLDRDESILET